MQDGQMSTTLHLGNPVKKWAVITQGATISQRHVAPEGKNRLRQIPSFKIMIATIMLVAVLGIVQTAEGAQESRIPSGGWKNMVLWGISIAAEFFDDLIVGDEIDESRDDRGGNQPQIDSGEPTTDTVAELFGIPRSEYGRWPSSWQRALMRAHASTEKFRRQTIHALTMFDASDWALLEKMASYAVQDNLFATTAQSRGFSELGVEDQLELEAMGIIATGAGWITKTLEPHSKTELYQARLVGEHALILWFRDENHRVAWKTALVTRTGQELVNLLGESLNDDYLRKLASGFAEHGIRTEWWKVTEIPGSDQFILNQKLWEVLPEKGASQ